MMKKSLTIILFVLISVLSLHAQENRIVPSLPEEGESIRVIIDTDAACEIDDLYAIALAIVSTDRFNIEGFVGTHFGDSGGPKGIERSVEAIQTVLEKAGMQGRYTVQRGADPFQYSQVPVESEGVDFIIEKAKTASREEPLWIIALGACTNVASAYLKDPSIAESVVVFWHGRTRWPDKCWNFNAYNDLKAVRILFRSNLPLILFDTGTYLRCPMEESAERIAPYGDLGKYLHEFRYKSDWYQSSTKGFYDLGDVAAVVDPSLVYHEVVHAPDVNWDMEYQHNKKHGKIRRIYQIDRDGTFDLLHEKLKQQYGR